MLFCMSFVLLIALYKVSQIRELFKRLDRNTSAADNFNPVGKAFFQQSDQFVIAIFSLYAFDQNGVMLDLWVYGSESISNTDGSSSVYATDANAAARYHEEDNGWRDKNWVLAYANTDYDDYDEDLYWFYLDSKGRPVLAGEDAGSGIDYTDDINGGTVRTVAAKSIKSKTYIFDDAGRMRTGLFKLEGVKKGNSSSAMDTGYYYFTEEEGSAEGQMITNKKVTIELDGEEETYYFSKTGEAYTSTVISGSLYGANGALVTDYGDGSSYQMVALDDILGEGGAFTEKGKSTEYSNAYVLINGNGKIKKSGTVTDVDGYKVTVKDYIVTLQKDEDGAVEYEADVVTDANGNKSAEVK